MDRLRSRLESREAILGVVGLGYVGLPLAVEMAANGFRVVGFDISESVVDGIQQGASHVQDIPSATVCELVRAGRLTATCDFSRLAECEAVSICVPTPLNKIKDPDLSFVVTAVHAVLHGLERDRLVILESTSYPGTTRDVVLPILEESGLEVGKDFYLCYSPERVDPGNPTWGTRNTPKVIGGITPACLEIGLSLYSLIFDRMVPVASAEAAELAKVYENTFRMINIALANELAQACDRLGVDVWGVIDAAATKPFGFMKFTPGPGLGGHCIPLDPHYLSWKMRTLAFRTRMIDLASEINAEMPGFVVNKIAQALNDVHLSLKGSGILLLGVTYKKDVDDLRESPALEILRLLEERGASVSYHDPHCPEIPPDAYPSMTNSGLRSVELTVERIAGSDCIVVVTDHTAIDYGRVLESARLVVDTRGVTRGLSGPARVVGLSG